MANNDFLNQFSNENYKKENKPIKEEMPNHFSSTQVKTGTVKKPEVKPMEKSIKVEPQNTLKSEQTIKDNKPDSFKEEKRVKVQKEPINPLLIIIPSIAALVIAAVLIYIFVFPHIVVPNFVGSSKEDVSAWIKQQQIETQGIILKEEYNFDAPIGQVLSQIPETGKVKKNAKMTFVVSKGADPDESISVPVLETMAKNEIESWIKENKLSNTKISTAYNDEVEEGKVISTSYANGYDSSNFTRGTQLKISISKGPKPADQVTVENFVKSDYSAVEAWAEKNKIKLTKTERYSDTIPLGSVISQSLEANKKLNQGDSFSVVVSKGKEIKMINVVGTSETEATKLLTKAGIEFVTRERYSTSPIGTIIDQSYSTGETMNDVEDLKIYVSIGNKISGIDLCETIDDLNDFISKANNLGASLRIKNKTYTYSNIYSKGTILSISKSGEISLNEEIDIVLSAGKIEIIDFVECGDVDKLETTKVIDYLSSRGINFTLTNPEYQYCTVKAYAFNDVTLQKDTDKTELSNNTQKITVLEGESFEVIGVEKTIKE